jgi:hypothetical protein
MGHNSTPGIVTMSGVFFGAAGRNRPPKSRDSARQFDRQFDRQVGRQIGRQIGRQFGVTDRLGGGI